MTSSNTGRLWVLGSVGFPAALRNLLKRAGELFRVIGHRQEIDVPDGMSTLYLVNVRKPIFKNKRRDIHCCLIDTTVSDPSAFLPNSVVGYVLCELARLGQLPQIGRHLATCASDVTSAGCPSVLYSDNTTAVDTGWSIAYPPTWVLWHAGQDERVAYGMEINETLLFTAVSESWRSVADAYSGHCPGVDAEKLLFWRCTQFAAIFRQSPHGIYHSVLETADQLRNLAVWQGGEIRCENHAQHDDMECPGCRPQAPAKVVGVTEQQFSTPFLQEAALFAGVAFRYDTSPDWVGHGVLGGAYTDIDRRAWIADQQARGRSWTTDAQLTEGMLLAQ